MARERRRLPLVPAPALPAIVWMAAFFLAPLAIVLVYSFGYKPALDAGAGPIALDRLSFANYTDALSGAYGSVFRATLETALLATVLCLLVAFPVALVLVRLPPRWRSVGLALVIIPFWTSFLLRAFAWRILLSGNGPLSEALLALGALDDPLRVLDTRGAVQLGAVYNYLPLMIFPIFVALERIDPALGDASADLGAPAWRTFVEVTVPLAAPGIAGGLLLVFIPLAGEYVLPAVLGGARGLMAGSLVASQFLEAQNWALGAAQAVVMIGLIVAALAVGSVVWVTTSWLAVTWRRRQSGW